MQQKKRASVIAVVIVSALFVTGCMNAGGGDSSSPAATSNYEIPPIEFATPGEMSSSSIGASQFSEDVTPNFGDANNVNTSLLTRIARMFRTAINGAARSANLLNSATFFEIQSPNPGDSGYIDAKFTLQKTDSSTGSTFSGVYSQRNVLSNGTFSDGGSIDNAPLEIFVDDSFTVLRVAIGVRPDPDSGVFRRDYCEYYFKSKGGIIGGEWREDGDAPEAIRIQIDRIINNDRYEFHRFANDDGPRFILQQNGTGFVVGVYQQSAGVLTDPAEESHYQLDRNGAESGTPTEAEIDALQAAGYALNETKAREELDRVFGLASLDAPVYDELQTIHAANMAGVTTW